MRQQRKPLVTERREKTGAARLRRVLMTTALSFILELCFFGKAYSAFEDNGTGARASALGGSYIALGDDIFSLYYNPAGLARLRQREVATEYSRFYPGLDDGSNIGQYVIAAGMPLRTAGTLAFGWKQFGLDGLYSERTLSLGYGQWLSKRWAAGAVVKHLSHAYASPGNVVDDNGNIQNTPPSLFSQNGSSRGRISLDTGLLFRVTDRQWLGAAIQDMTQPNMALDAGDTDPVARRWRFGWAYQSPRRYSTAASFATRQVPGDQRDYLATTGGEKAWFFNRFGETVLRGALTMGTHSFRQLSLGFGYRQFGFTVNYAFAFNIGGLSLGDSGGVHRFSIHYRLGKEPIPATTPRGVPIDELPVNILRAADEDNAFSLEQDEQPPDPVEEVHP